MKKIALSLTAATMIFAGLAGCGDVNDTGMNDTTGYTANQGQRTGTTTGLGFDNNRFGADRNTGFTRERGNDYYGIHDRGFGTQRGRGFGARGDINQTTRNNNVGQGSGLVGEERNFGSAFDYQPGNTTPHDNFRGQNRNRNRNAIGFDRGNRDYRGFGRGITGNDRPGMVDENGILNRFDTNNRGGAGALNRGNRGFNRGTGGLNGGTMNRGTMNRGTMNDNRGFDNGRTTGFNQDKHRNNGTAGLNRGTGRTGITGQTRTGAYYDTEDGRLATRINDHIRGDNYRDARVIVNGDDIVIGVEGNENRNVAENLRNRVRGLAGERNVHVVTDRNHVRSIRDMDDRLQAGEAFDEIGATFTQMLDDLGDAATRPFERTRR